MKNRILLLVMSVCAMMLIPIICRAAQETDAGLVMQIAGQATYQNDRDQHKPLPVSAFMKLRIGDRLKLAKDSHITLLFIKTGKKEIWKGPADLTIGKSGATSANGSSPEKVIAMPEKVSEALMTSPITSHQLSLSGATPIRGDETRTSLIQTLPTDPAVRDADIASARKISAELKQTSLPDDLSAELYLLTELSKYRLYDDMSEIVRNLSEKDSDNALTKQWQEWIARKKAAFPILIYMTVLRKDPQCKGGSDCIRLPETGICRRYEPFLPEDAVPQKIKAGDFLSFFLKNDSAKDFYVYLLNIGSDGKSVIFPAASDTGMIRAGEGIDLLVKSGLILMMEKPGQEQFRLLISETPADTNRILSDDNALKHIGWVINTE